MGFTELLGFFLQSAMIMLASKFSLLAEYLRLSKFVSSIYVTIFHSLGSNIFLPVKVRAFY